MPELATYLISGTILGLTAGISPGPLLTLVISESLTHGSRQGVRVAFVPFLSDIPIVLICIFLLSQLSNFHFILGVLTCIGAVFVAYLGFESSTVKGLNANSEGSRLSSFSKGLIINLLSPYPYLFWISVGGPMLLKAFGINPLYGAAFLFSFYLFLVYSKVIIALVVGKPKPMVTDRIYRFVIKAIAGILFGFAIYLLFEGLKLIGVVI